MTMPLKFTPLDRFLSTCGSVPFFLVFYKYTKGGLMSRFVLEKTLCFMVVEYVSDKEVFNYCKVFFRFFSDSSFSPGLPKVRQRQN